MNFLGTFKMGLSLHRSDIYKTPGIFSLCFQKDSAIFPLCEVITLLNWTVDVVIRK